MAGRTFDLDVVGVAAGLDEGTALDALDAALASGLVVEIGIDQPDRPPSRLTPAAGMPAIGPVGLAGHATVRHPGDGQRTVPPPRWDRRTQRRRYQYRFAHDIVQRTVVRPAQRGPAARTCTARLADAIEGLRADDLDAHAARPRPPPRGQRRPARRPAGGASGPGPRPAQARERRAPSEALRLCCQALQPRARPTTRPCGPRSPPSWAWPQVAGRRPGGEETLLDGPAWPRMSGRLDLAGRAPRWAWPTGPHPHRPARRGGDADRRGAAHPARAGARPTPSARWCGPGCVARQIELGHDPGADDDLAGALGEPWPPLRRPARPPSWASTASTSGCTLAEELATTATAAGDRGHLVAGRPPPGDDRGDHRRPGRHRRGRRRAGQGGLRGRAPTAGAAAAGRAGGGPGRQPGPLRRGRGLAAGSADATAAAPIRRSARLVPPAGSQVDRQLFVTRWLQARPGDCRPRVPDRSTVERALVALDRADRGRARISLHAVATGVDPLPEGDEWLHAAGLLGLAAAELGDPGIAAAARNLLAPHAELRLRRRLPHLRGHGHASTWAGWRPLTGDLARRRAPPQLGAAPPHRGPRPAPGWRSASNALAGVLEDRGRSSDRDWSTALRSEADLGRPPPRHAAPA